MFGRVLIGCSLMLVVARVVEAQAAGDDPFVAAHRVALPGGAGDRVVTLRTKDGRRRFQPREPIVLELSVSLARGADPATRDHTPEISGIVFDRQVDVSTPLEALTADPGGPSAGVSCCVTGPPPWTTTFLLNGHHRIDRPGPLRLFVQSRRSHHGAHAADDISNILTIEIAPRDQAWEVAAARSAAAVLDNPASSSASVDDAVASLESLATVEAGRVLLRRATSSGTRPPLTALFAIDDRAAALRLMEDELQRPERPIDGHFIGATARLARAGRHPEGPPYPHDELHELARHYAVVRARALAAILGLTGAIATELTEAARRDWDAFRGAVAPAIHAFPVETAAALRTMQYSQIEWLLRKHRRRFAHRSLLPLLRDLYQKWDGFKSVALHPICDVSLDECRSYILEELARDTPRLDIEVMGRLPDAALAAMEAAWVRLLETSIREETLVAAAERLERFGTEVPATRAAQTWLSRRADWTPDVDGPLIAFLSRVKPSLAVQVLEVAANDPETMSGAGRDRALPGAIAAHEWNDTVERFALESLTSGNYAVVRQAATALSAYGSAAGRQGIERALQRLRRTWPRQDDADAEVLEEALAEALVTAPAWRLSGRSRFVAAAACIGDRCRERLRPRDASIVEPQIQLISPWGDQILGTTFWLDEVTLPSVPALIAKLRQYPAGTRFYFDPLSSTPAPTPAATTPGARRTIFEEVKAEAARHGIVVLPEYTLAK
jgi:hypothetical protein